MESLYYSQGRRPRKRGGLFAPFLIILCIVVILVLLVQIVMSLKMQTNETKRNQAFMYLERGDIEFQPWGQDTWHEAYNQALIWEGDRIRTDKDSYAVLEFYDGSRIRINEGTELFVEKIEAEKKFINVDLRLTAGEIWVNEKSTEENLKFRIYTPHLDVMSLGTRFAVAVQDQEFVRVTEGEVKVMVYDNFADDPELLDSVSVGVGQQTSVSVAEIEALEARKFVNLLESTDDYWKVTEWYLWNVREDENPTVYVVKESDDATIKPVDEGTVEEVTDGEVAENDSAVPEVSPLVTVPSPKVTITTPETSPYDMTESRIYLKGTVSLDVTKVIVTEFYDDPQGKPYQLSKFVPGSGVWNYAAGLDFGNLKPGANRFVVQAYNGDGLVSDPVEVIVNAPGGEEESELVEEEETVVVPVTDTADTSAAPSEVIIEPATPTKLITKTQPIIVSFEEAEKTKENYFVTTSERVVINGTVGGAQDVTKVIVNDWPLSLYEQGSSQWTYYAKTSINTLKRGVNVYNVYTEDSKGERSLSLTFTIEKK